MTEPDMRPSRPFIDGIKVASPCAASWEAMRGDERVRFCDRCDKHVYNLSGMTRPEAEAFVRKAEGRTCVRFYLRADGSVLTDDCPVAVRAARRLKLMAASVAAGVVTFFAWAFSRDVPPETPVAIPTPPPIVVRPELREDVVMGMMMPDPPPPADEGGVRRR